MNSENQMPYYNGRINKPNTFATLSVIFGIIGVFLSSTFIIPLILGSLGAIMAILSKEDRLRMTGPAKTGFILCVAAVVTTITMTCSTVYLYFNNDTYRQEINESYKEVYGVTLDEYIEQTIDMYQDMQ